MKLLNSNEIFEVRDVIKSSLIMIIDEINQFLSETNNIPTQPSWEGIFFLNDNNSLIHKTFNSLDFNIIKSFLETNFFSSSFDYQRDFLIINEFFSDQHEDFFNPLATPFGSFVYSYFELATENADNSDQSSIYPIKFNNESFNLLWEGFIPYFSNEPFNLKLIYAIFGADFNGDQKFINNDLKFIKPSIDQKNTIVHLMKVPVNFLEEVILIPTIGSNTVIVGW